jgi:hypothetical protein
MRRISALTFICGFLFLANQVHARFLQTDPVGYKDDLDLYTYVSNDPTDRVDPTGRYTCTGSQGQCQTVDNFVNQARNAMSHLDKNSDAYKKISLVLNYFGAAGVKNGVVFNPTSLGTGVLASAGEHGTINVDIGHIGSYAASLEKYNASFSPAYVRNGIGAGALAHEGRHERDFQRLWGGNGPSNKQQEYRTEMNAYTTEAGVHRGLGLTTGLNSPGMTDQQRQEAIENGAQGSTDAYCAAGGSC